MPSDIRLNAIHPIGETNPQNMPVADVARAIPYYTDKLGFTLRETEGEPPTAAQGWGWTGYYDTVTGKFGPP